VTYIQLYNSECTGAPTEFDIVLHDDLRRISIKWSEVTFDRGVTGYQVQAKPLAAQGAAQDDVSPSQIIEVFVIIIIIIIIITDFRFHSTT
jgi:prolipoprotein diacylglyceryltransferase